MKVTVAAPIDLRLLAPLLDTEVRGAGFSFPMTAHLVRVLVERDDLEVSVVAMDPATTETYRLRGPRLDVRVVPLRPRAKHHIQDFFRAERRAMQAEIADLHPDVIHAHWTYEFALAAEKSGFPTVVTVHDWGPSILAQHRDLYRLARLGMQVRAISRARCLTAVSPRIQTLVQRAYRKSVLLVPNGLPEEYFEQRPRPAAADGVTFGALVNGVDPNKNLQTLLEAFTRHGLPSDRLVLAGHGCAKGDPLHSWAVEHGRADHVEFRGPMSPAEVPAYVASLDVFVHPSLEESFGMVILEAMAGGVPVIGGSRSGAVPWLLEDGQAGVLTDVRDPAALAQALESMGDPAIREQYADAGRVRAEQFRMSEVAGQYVELYDRLASGQAPTT